MRDEFYQTKEYAEASEFFPATSGNVTKKRSSRYKKLRKMGYLVAAVISVASVTHSIYPEFSILPKSSAVETEKTEPEISQKPEPTPEKPAENPTGKYEQADAAFPTLGNLMPNTKPLANGIAEQFLLVSDGSQSYWLYQDSHEYYGPTATYEGMAYHPDTNTLTLTNCTAGLINANMMGNGFTIELIGENHVGAILAWGYQYGGSIKITGNGSLVINEDNQYACGIELLAENSESCLMIDGNAEVEIWGREVAFLITSTTCEKGLYFLKPNQMTGGFRNTTNLESEQNGFAGLGTNFTITDEGGNPVTYVRFSKDAS